MGGGTSLKHWFTSSVKKRCAKGFKLGTGPHKCAQWASNRVLWLLLTSPAVWLRTRMARAASTHGHDETSSYESSSCQPSCRPGVTPLLCDQVHCDCTSTGQLASSCLQMFLNRASVSRFKAAWVPVPSASHWHASARTRTSKWRPGPATSWPARTAPRVPRPTSDTSRQVTGKRRADNLMSISPVKGNSSTDVLMLAVQWWRLRKVCTRSRVRIPQLFIIFQIVWNFVYTRIFAYIRVYTRIR